MDKENIIKDEALEEAAPEKEISETEKKKNDLVQKVVGLFKSNKLFGIGAAALGVLIVIIIIAICASNSPKSVAKKYAKGYLKGDGTKVMKCLPDKLLEKVAEEEGKTLKALKSEMKREIDYNKEAMTGRYGKYKIKVKVTSVENLDKDEFNTMKEEVLEETGVKISKAKRVNIEFSVNGDKYSHSSDDSLILIKIGSKWSVYDKNLF